MQMTLTLGKTFIHRERKEEVESRTTLNQLKNDTYSSQTLMLHTRLKESGFANSTSLIHEKPTQPQHRPSSGGEGSQGRGARRAGSPNHD